MDEDRTWGVITQERLSLADLLEGLTPEEWERPSLCPEWRVRDVAAHLAMIPDSPGPLALARAAVRVRGNPHRLNVVVARDRARHSPEQLVAELREHAASRRVPIVTNWRNVLFDVLVHGQDIAVPLGIPRRMDVDAARAGADRVWGMGWPFLARRRLRGIRLVATDTDWTVGSGVEVRGPIQAMLVALTGRPAALRELTGDGVSTLAERLGPANASRGS